MSVYRSKPIDYDRREANYSHDLQGGVMATREEMSRRLAQLRDQRAHLDTEIERLGTELAVRVDAFEGCRVEASTIAQQMNEWEPLNAPVLFPGAPLSVLFLGAVSGEWAAQSRYRGVLPGFGGFLIVAGGLNIVVDPGRSTLGNLHAAEIHPRTLDLLIATHSHWDCVRDLQLLIMAATDTHISSARSGRPRLRLLAPRSVLQGHPMDVDAVIEDPLFAAHEEVAATKQRLGEFTTMNAPALSAFDLFVRLSGGFETLEIGQRYQLAPEVEMYTRPSFHRDTFGVEAITGLDIVVRKDGQRAARCVYLSDTEYRRELADLYAEDELGPIDILICNVKTLDVRPQPAGPYRGYTLRHLGWKGLVQLTHDLQKRGLLTPASLVVLRAWGIETVTRLDPNDGVMTATPEKLRVYEETFRAETHQSAVVPGQTWVAVADGDGSPPRVHHLRGPFPPEGAFQRFGSICYCSDQMADIVRAVRPVVENASELLLVTGETGTGKDALANSIHIESRRPGTPVIENASALGTDMAQDQLVGHSKGTFTGADADRDGWLTEAAGGTLIIQEIGDMPLEHQIKLLTILGERKYRRLGDHRKYELTAQLTMTTSLDVDALVAAGLFRPELLFRFQRRVHIPPLRERLEDIRAIVQGWHVDRPDFYPQLPEPALALLCSYDWPGNVRSLENVFVRLRDGGDWTLEQIREEVEREHRRHTATPRPGGGPALEPAEQGLLELLALGRAMPRREIERLLPAANKATTVKRLNRLIRKGLVRKVGNGPTACYQRVA